MTDMVSTDLEHMAASIDNLVSSLCEAVFISGMNFSRVDEFSTSEIVHVSVHAELKSSKGGIPLHQTGIMSAWENVVDVQGYSIQTGPSTDNMFILDRQFVAREICVRR